MQLGWNVTLIVSLLSLNLFVSLILISEVTPLIKSSQFLKISYSFRPQTN